MLLVVVAVIAYTYLVATVHTTKDYVNLCKVLNSLEKTFIHLESTQHDACLRIVKVETTRTIVNDTVLVIEHVAKLYIGSNNCDCTWVRTWLCLGRDCAIVDLSGFADRLYILDRQTLCNYVNVRIGIHSNTTIVHIK